MLASVLTGLLTNQHGRCTVVNMSNDLDRAARTLAKDRARVSASMHDAERAAVAAHADGVPETEIARTLGVNRTTVRKWLGK